MTLFLGPPHISTPLLEQNILECILRDSISAVGREFVQHKFHFVWEEDLNITAVDNKTKLGTHMLTSHHATHNNFHLHNNFVCHCIGHFSRLEWMVCC